MDSTAVTDNILQRARSAEATKRIASTKLVCPDGFAPMKNVSVDRSTSHSSMLRKLLTTNLSIKIDHS